MKRTIFATIAMALVFALGAAAPSFADGPKLISIRVNGGIVASSESDRAGTATFFNLPEGQYQISIDASRLTKPTVVKVQAGRNAPLTSAPILPGRRAANDSINVVLSNAAGEQLTFVIPPGSGAPRGAAPKAVAGPAPRDANPLSTVVVTIIGDLGPMPPKT